MMREKSCHTPCHSYNFILNDLHSVEAALITGLQYSEYDDSQSYPTPDIQMKAFLWLSESFYARNGKPYLE